MRAVGYYNPGSIDRADALLDLSLPDPIASGHDILVEVRAISVNPLDTWKRRCTGPSGRNPKVLGYDAAGIIKAIGPDVTLFRAGDEVFYAGSVERQGANAELHLVDERIVGPKAAALGWAEAAALPLGTVTAWEALFDRLDVSRIVPGAMPAVLIIGGTGGVGSVAVQIARQLTDLQVLATTSGTERQDQVRRLGAHHVLDHSQPLDRQVEALGCGAPAFVFSTTHTAEHLDEIATLIAPQGRFALIDDPEPFDIKPFKHKSASVHWEFMDTRPGLCTADIAEQGRILSRAAELVDGGRLRPIISSCLHPICAETLKEAHRRVEQGGGCGKIVIEGWQ